MRIKSLIKINIENLLPYRWFFYSFVALCLVGLAMIMSSTPVVGMNQYDDSLFYIKKHLAALFVGVGALLFGFSFDYKKLREYIPHLLGLSIILLALLYTPMGITVFGGTRWIKIGLTFQPSELAKVALIFFLANAIAIRGSKVSNIKEFFLPVSLVIGLVLLLILREPDLSTTVLIGAVMAIMMFTGGVPIWFLFILLIIGVRGVIYYVSHNHYQMNRIKAFLDPWADRWGVGYQSVQSFIAVGSGGLFGLGLGNSRQKFMYLPQQYTDYIYAIICEELGLVGGVGVLVILLIFAYQGFKLATRIIDPFGRFIVVGIVSMIVIQSFLHISVVLGLVPPTGIPMPFISFGGTSLVVSMYMIGVVLNIANQNKVPNNE